MFNQIDRARVVIRRNSGKIIRWIFHHLPISAYYRRELQSMAYRSCPIFFRNMTSYQIWLHRNVVASKPEYDANTLLDSIEISFPVVSSPVVSVIIFVADEQVLMRCLRSLLVNPAETHFEVLLIVDATDVQLAEKLSKINGVKIIYNEEVATFSSVLSLSVSHARGNYFLLLDQSVTAVSGSIDELFLTFRQYPQAGVVGGKLINADGNLICAGSLILKNANIINMGEGCNPSEPAYNFCCEVDSCPAAFIMISRELATEYQEMSAVYSSQQLNDAEIALVARSRGRKVIYQPLAAAILNHKNSVVKSLNEFVDSEQIKSFQKRWSTLLDKHKQTEQDARKAHHVSSAGRILIIDACTPTPDKDAGSVTAFYFMQIFTELGMRVSFIPGFDFLRQDRYTADLQRIGVECQYAPFVTDVTAYLEKYGKDFDVVLLYRVDWAAEYIGPVRRHCPKAKIIFDTVDLHYLRQERQAVSENSVALAKIARTTKMKELAVMCQADMTIVLSDIEKDILAVEIPNANVESVPLILDIPGRAADYSQRDGIVFIGGYSHEPNIDAVMYFAKEIWPTIKQKIPEIIFYILGSNPPEKIKALHGNGIEVVGYVESLDQYFNNCRVSVVPLRYGAGIKGKVGTSFSYGLPVVSTSVGIEGMGIEPGMHAMVAENANDFAQAVIDLYLEEDTWQSLSASGLAFAREYYSLDTGKKTLSKLLQKLGVSIAEKELCKSAMLNDMINEFAQTSN